jgi:GTP-binding protein
MHINKLGEMKKHNITSLMAFKGLDYIEVDKSEAGDIVAIAGIPDICIGDTIADIECPKALPPLFIQEPIVKMTFSVNTSPFAGNEGLYTTSRQIRERLYQELEHDVALRVEDNQDGSWTVSGRGELHLAILIERLRREGYAFQVSQPQVIAKTENGQQLMPYEEVFIETPASYSSAVIQELQRRYAKLKKMEPKENYIYLEFIIPTQGLFGYKNLFLTATHGMGIMNTRFYQYLPDSGQWKKRDKGSLVAWETGTTRVYGLTNVQDRGELFVGPTTRVYKGQVVGQNNRDGDIMVNVCKEKQLSNMRSKGEGVSRHLNTAKIMDLDSALAYIEESELLDITPAAIRIRKIILDEKEAKRLKKSYKH